jgi:hypothetical protein
VSSVRLDTKVPGRIRSDSLLLSVPRHRFARFHADPFVGNGVWHGRHLSAGASMTLADEHSCAQYIKIMALTRPTPPDR